MLTPGQSEHLDDMDTNPMSSGPELTAAVPTGRVERVVGDVDQQPTGRDDPIPSHLVWVVADPMCNHYSLGLLAEY